MGRSAKLRELAEALTEYDAVRDAWTAKSFTDRLFVVEVEPGDELPEEVRERLETHGLQGYNAVHDTGIENTAFAGSIADGDRYRFVDTETRGQLQSYVIE